jgi:hypothetical protein
VGYSNPAPQTGEAVLFDFRLTKAGEVAPFTDAWVKITDANQAVVFASGIHNNSFGGSRMSYVFPGAGTYTVDVRYETDTDPIAESSFPLTIVPAPRAFPGKAIALWAAGAVVLVGAGLAFVRRRNKSHG